MKTRGRRTLLGASGLGSLWRIDLGASKAFKIALAAPVRMPPDLRSAATHARACER
jgi:hypothetical protein